jgi:hypothetical protein
LKVRATSELDARAMFDSAFVREGLDARIMSPIG